MRECHVTGKMETAGYDIPGKSPHKSSLMFIRDLVANDIDAPSLRQLIRFNINSPSILYIGKPRSTYEKFEPINQMCALLNSVTNEYTSFRNRNEFETLINGRTVVTDRIDADSPS